MSREAWIVGFLITIYALWVLLPLVPSILIYWLFPDVKVAASGPLAHLTVKTSGAFAAYLIVFLATLPVVMSIRTEIFTFEKQFWTLSGTIHLVGADGKEIRSQDLLQKIGIEVVPNPFQRSSYFVELKVMQDNSGEFPKVTFRIPNFGEANVNLNSVSPDAIHKSFDLGDIEIRRVREVNAEAAIAIEPQVDDGARKIR